MRVHIVFDENGGIVAAAKLDSDTPVRVRPIADEQAGYPGGPILCASRVESLRPGRSVAKGCC